MSFEDRTSDTGFSFDLVHARILRSFPDVVRELGGKPEAMLEGVGVDPARCSGESAITYRQWVAVVETAARELGVADFGMRLATRQGGAGVYGPLGSAMRNSRTFGEALSYVTTHNAAHSLAARVWKGKTASGQHVFFGHEILVGSISSRCQAVEQILLLGHLGARAITGDRVSARRVHFRHRELSPPAVYRRHFGCETKFCRNEDGIAFRSQDMGCPIMGSDTEALAGITSLVEKAYGGQRAPFSAQVRGIIMQRLGTSGCGNEHVARELGVHPRTLHRRLTGEGTSFQRMKDEVRRDYMLYYLEQTDLELSLISEKLGFAEQATLSRFARDMLGASPSDVRSRARNASRPPR